LIETVLKKAIKQSEIDDPLLRIVEDIETGSHHDRGETLNLAALFAVAGAAIDAQEGALDGVGGLPERLRNSDRISAKAGSLGWSPVLPDRSLRSGVLLLRARAANTRRLAPGCLRAAFLANRISLTAYSDGLVRLAMPVAPFTPTQRERLTRTLSKLS
jgi:hypothetical protein